MKLFLLLAGVSAVLCAVPKAPTPRDLLVETHADGGFVLTVVSESGAEVLGHIGRRFDGDEEVSFDVTSTFDAAAGGYKITVHWDGPSDRVFEDCFDFGSKQWYGGPEQKEQYWPIQHGHLNKYSIISKEDDNAAVAERYWLNSEGHYFYVYPEAPLFVDHHNILENHICFIAEVTAPYSSRRTHNVLKYDIWIFENAKIAHQHAIDTYLGKPTGIPDYRMIQYPVWSTWARYSREIDQDSLWAFANEIKDSGFPNAQFEIDDLWEICYGSLTVDERKLPNLKQLVQDIKSLGFRVAIWVHPFINKDCDPWYTEAVDNGYLVLNEEGSPDSSWWNNNGSVPGYIDFTNPEAGEWFSSRLQTLIETYDIDTLKFDAGESSWSPQIPVQNGDIDLHPSHIVQSYVRTVAKFGPIIEVRSGMRTQDLPIFIRMVDKDTLWDFNNGLATLVTTLLQMNLNGYTLVLPDMIGGNGYNEKPSKELFVRWLQANVFMPALQFSFVPWDHDDEAVEISRKFTQLHADYADEIVAAMEASVRDGTPVNAPIWWLDPTDQQALATWDEFLLGERILVAPVLEEGATSRDIYLPRGTWRDANGALYEGPVALEAYPAPLDIPVQTGDVDMHPHHIVQSYVRTCARFGDMIEVRSGFRTQDLPIFVRMVDRDSTWGLVNGLSTIITTTFQMNLGGYTLVLPDMIGGNGYNLANEGSTLPTKQLFIRWVQVNTFLPVMQFSFLPWGFDNETAEISLKYTQLHAEYAQTIYAAMNASTLDGRPVNGPLWWIAPNDADALTIWDQYLLGEDIIVAPVLVENATSRDIYLPAGEWLAKGDSSEIHVGPIWLRDYPAPLEELPYFVKRTDEPDAASAPRVAAVLIAAAVVLAVFNVQ